MTAEPPQSTSEARFAKLSAIFAAHQTHINCVPDLQVRHMQGEEVEVLFSGRWQQMTMEKAAELFKAREVAISNAQVDPFRYGHEPEAWRDLDWLTLRKRLENPGIAIEILILGGQGSGKSFFGARCLNRFGFYNPMCLLWAFSTDELNSKSVMQPAVYSYLPKELRTATGKAKRTKNQKIIYTTAGGFTGNVLGFPNGTVMQFRFHSSELATLEGPRPHFVVTDENVPLTWVEAITDRLRSRADMSRKFMPEFEELWARKQANPSLRFPPDMVSRLYMGVHLIMFTPKFGYTATVHAFMKDARTLKEVPAELLKENGHGPRMVPREMDGKLTRRAVFFMHPTDNPHAGNYSSFVAERDTMTEETILWKVYGIASKKSHVLFPKFSSQIHVRKHEQILKAAKGGTWWMVTDPAAGRNMFCLWVCVNPHNEIFIVREWPQEDDYVPGYGFLGPWAIEGSKLDGAPGPAQNPLGMGAATEASEFERVERRLYFDEHQSEGRIEPYVRIIDSRSGNSPTMADSETRTLIQIFEQLGLWFQPAGKESGALDGQTRVEESTKMVNSLLDYDVEKTKLNPETGGVTFMGKAPRLYISERCTNTIFSLSTWTNADGQKGACKDPIDCLRYLTQADPFYVEQRKYDPTINHGVY